LDSMDWGASAGQSACTRTGRRPRHIGRCTGPICARTVL